MASATTILSSLPLSLALSPHFHNKTRGCCNHASRTMLHDSGARIRFSPHYLSCNQRRSSACARKNLGSSPAATEEPPFNVLVTMKTLHNDIMIVDSLTTRFLTLDSTNNIHSMLNKEQPWTGSYWDEFASLPAIVPDGPIAILGLGGGTAAHTMLKAWPHLHLQGWEIDEILIDMAREYFGLSDLEKCTSVGGFLSVHIGDALSESVTTRGGFAGIIVDLFSGGEILPQLKKVSTWLDIEKKLMPKGRILVNCGGAFAEVYGSRKQTANATVLSTGSWIKNSTIKALCQAFPGKLSWKRMEEKDSDNYLALTGSLPDLDAWSAAVPAELSMNVKAWRMCELCS